MQVRITRSARVDLVDIWDYLADSSERIADECIDRIVARCDRLVDFPARGSRRPDVAPDARLLVVERWSVFYRITADEVQIVRVVDGVRDISKLIFPHE